jgi:replication initiation and membrane attachment protein DnaB
VVIVSVTEKDIRRVLLKHPWLPYDYAKRIAEDLKRKKTSTPEGLRKYNREYMRLRRAEKRGEVSDVAGIISGKYLKKKRREPNSETQS